MPEVITISGGISQLQDLMSNQKFAEIILAGINTSEKVLDLGDQAIAAGKFDEAEELWKKAWENMNWIALNVIQRRLRIGKNEPAEVRGRLRKFWMRIMVFGMKKKIAKAAAVAAAT